MGSRMTIARIGEWEGQAATIHGWLYNRRSSGKIEFLIIRDGTGFIQAVAVRSETGEELFRRCQELTPESSVVVTGTVRRDPRSPGGFELGITGLEVVQLAEEYPIALKEHGVDFLLDRRHLWLRTPRQVAVMRVRAKVISACRQYLDDLGFVNIDAPILTPAACEGTTTLFETQYFGDKAYLTQSGQLYNEAAAMALGRVYCFGPAFRAEKSKTRRHLIEFWMLEPEAAYCDFQENMAIQEGLIYTVVRRVLEENRADLELLGRDPARLEAVKTPFPRISYDQAIEMLKDAGHDVTWGQDFGAPDETVISESFDRPVFVSHFPAAVKAFYMQPDPVRPEVVLGADLLAPEGVGEIIGGGERIHDLELLRQRIVEHKLPEDSYEWYVDLRRYGSVPHSGFGLGIERTVAWLCGLEHVREAIPFPRLLNRIYP